ncbi:MAG: helix-turn-helix domain-containing protein, partial [Clostridium sp.]
YAANLLAHSDKEIIDITFEIGFNSLGNFYNLFKKQYGISPLKYRNKYSFNFPIRE